MILSNRRVTTDEFQITCKSVMVLQMKSFKTGQPFIKFLEDGISSNSEMSTSAKALIRASDFWIAIKTKVTTFWVTGDQTWIYYYELECTCQSMKWNISKCWSKESLNSQWSVLEYYHKRATIVKSACKWVMLSDKMTLLHCSIMIMDFHTHTHCHVNCSNPPATPLLRCL